ncbi:MAG: energy transducer TonB, partial [Pseudomonadota bacterium]
KSEESKSEESKSEESKSEESKSEESKSEESKSEEPEPEEFKPETAHEINLSVESSTISNAHDKLAEAYRNRFSEMKLKVKRDLEAGFQRQVAPLLKRAKTYPDIAKQQGIEGITILEFTISKDGTLSNIRVVHSSGSEILDEASKKILIQTAPQFPPIPIHYDLTKVTMVFPFDYKLL